LSTALFAGVLSVALALPGAARAQDDGPTFQGLVDNARTAILASDWKKATALLTQAEELAPKNPSLILEKDLGRLYFYRGLVEYRAGDKDSAALEWWRKAIVLSPKFEPEADVLPEQEGQDVFYALTGEVNGRQGVTLDLPDDPGDAVIFVDGRKMESTDGVVIGTHFVQLRCGEGNVVGSWYTFGTPPPDYLVLCSGGSYPTPKGAKPTKPAKPKKDVVSKEAKKAAEKAEADRAAIEAAAAAAVAHQRELADQHDQAAQEVADKEAADKAALEAAGKGGKPDKKAEKEREKAEKEAAEKAKAEADAAAKAEAEKAAADKAAAEKAGAEKAAAEKAAADKALAEKEAADKAAADKAAADKAAADKAAADKAAADKAAADKAVADKAAADKAAADKAAADKALTEKQAADKAAADREKAEKEKADKDAAEKARAEQEKADKEKALADAEKEKADREAADKARADKEKAEKEKADREAADKARADKEKSDKEKAAQTNKASAHPDKSVATVDHPHKGHVAARALLVGSGALLASGAAVNFLVVNPAYDAWSNSTKGQYSREDADTIVNQFNAGRFATIGLFAAGAATLGVGIALGPLDAHLTVSPQSIGVSGAW
jgi:hypothetical protein